MEVGIFFLYFSELSRILVFYFSEFKLADSILGEAEF